MIQQGDLFKFLFENSFLASIIFSPKDEYAVDVMFMMGNQSNFKITLIALVAGICGSIVNYYIGYLIRYLETLKIIKDYAKSISKGEKFFKNGGFLLLFLSFSYLWGPLITLTAGFYRIKFVLFLMLVSLSRAIYLYLHFFF
jgi:membrane protein YqaA with SNARE-associated domain